MKLLPPQQENIYLILNDIIQTTNSSATLQGYAMIKRRIKTSKKVIECKAVLICDYSTKYVIENWYKKNITN